MADDADLPAGDFSTWVNDFRAALRGERAAEVPCDGCTACCASSQFVHIAPDESDTLARIPSELRFPAPRMPDGHVVLGYDERGCCPMLRDDGCSIYAHRPRACRTYDCRVFVAAGVEVDDDNVLLARRVRRWRFDHPTAVDVQLHEAVRSAARHLADAERRPGDREAPVPRVEIALRAIEVAERQSLARRQGA
jgi:Fe-S-cluster containining protein